MPRVKPMEEGEPKAPVLLWKLSPGRPVDEDDLEELEQGLERMGCAGLLKVPWSFKDETMVREVMEGAPN